MNKRICDVRKSQNLNQQDFADKLGLTKNFISLLETGSREPSDRTIKDICREFSVNEKWLRTGDGEMHIPVSREEEIADMVSKAIGGTNEFKRAVIRMICSRSEAELVALEKMLWDIVAELEKEKGQTEV
jgi:transcriptional regulator with XRE-family HTH domain